MTEAPSTVGLLVFLIAVGLVRFYVVTMTGFLKISVVMFIIRNALGLQQTPPSLVLYGIALVLTVYVTTPLIGDVFARLSTRPADFSSLEKVTDAAKAVREPIQAHLLRFTKPGERQFFLSATTRALPAADR